MKAKKKPASKRVASDDLLERRKYKRGIAAYEWERRLLLRIVRRRGSFTEIEFDKWLLGRESKRPLHLRPITGDTYILGVGRNGGTAWAFMLDLMHLMIAHKDGIGCRRKGRLIEYYAL